MENKSINIKSEIGRLKTVVLHRPGAELEGLTPSYLNKLLFDDIPYLERAQFEHDAFADTLRSRGVEVLYLDQLMTESLSSPDVKMRFISDMVRASKQGDRRTTYALIDHLGSMETKDMVQKVMAGIRKNEINLPEERGSLLHSFFADDHPFYLDPMPNLYYTRDPATAIDDGVSVSKMHFPARRREALFIEYILKYHPLFAPAHAPLWYDRYGRFSVEGGDILVLSKDVVAIGVSERTAPEAIEKIATKLFTGSRIKRVLALEIPKTRAFMHLDTVLAMIDYDKFLIHSAILQNDNQLNTFVIDRGEDPLSPVITKRTDFEKVLKEALKIDHLTLIECGGGDPVVSAREQWSNGVNVLTLAPGVVVAYERNHVTNQILRDLGVEVIEIDGSELGRGRGGPRCMSMPIVREDIY